jgi:hypothetical protein
VRLSVSSPLQLDLRDRERITKNASKALKNSAQTVAEEMPWGFVYQGLSQDVSDHLPHYVPYGEAHNLL